MEAYEDAELKYLNELTRRNRIIPQVQESRPVFPHWIGPCLRWLVECWVLIVLAHNGAIAGWIMHLGTLVLTFQFAFGAGRSVGYERRMTDE